MKKQLLCSLLLVSSLGAESHYGRALTKLSLGGLTSGLVYRLGVHLYGEPAMEPVRAQRRFSEGALALFVTSCLWALKDCGYDWAGDGAKKILAGYGALTLGLAGEYHDLFPQAWHDYCVARRSQKSTTDSKDKVEGYYFIRGVHALLWYELFLRLLNSKAAHKVSDSFDQLFENVKRRLKEDQKTSDSLS